MSPLEIFILIVSLIIAVATAPKPPKSSPLTLEDFDIPTAEEDRSIPAVFGSPRITGPNVVWHGDFSVDTQTKDKVKTRKYFLGMHFALAYTLDRVNKILVDEQVVWDTGVEENDEIYLNKPDLFGGRDKEGGIQGYMDVMFGRAGQGPNAYLTAKQGGPQPAYLGVTTLVAKEMYLVANSSYIKPWSFEVTRLHEGWTCWGWAGSWVYAEMPALEDWDYGKDAFSEPPWSTYAFGGGGIVASASGVVMLSGYSYWYNGVGDGSETSRVFTVSSDGGQSFSDFDDFHPYVQGTEDWGYDPYLSPDNYSAQPAAHEDTFYIATNTGNNVERAWPNGSGDPEDAYDAVILHKSTNAGASWTSIEDSATQIAVCAVAASANGVYIVGRNTAQFFVDSLDYAGWWVARTVNDGTSWTKTELAGLFPQYYDEAPRAADAEACVDPLGNCHFLLRTYTTAPPDYDGEVALYYVPPTGAGTWGTPILLQLDSTTAEGLNEGMRIKLMALKATPGVILAFWADAYEERLRCRRSTDYGATWGATQVVHNDATDGVIAVSSYALWGCEYDVVELDNGSIAVVFSAANQDDDGDIPVGEARSIYRVSTDGGVTYGGWNFVEGQDDVSEHFSGGFGAVAYGTDVIMAGSGYAEFGSVVSTWRFTPVGG